MAPELAANALKGPLSALPATPGCHRINLELCQLKPAESAGPENPSSRISADMPGESWIETMSAACFS